MTTTPSADVTLGVSLYSYGGDFLVTMTLEDCLADVADMGATDVEILADTHIEGYPTPSSDWVDRWHALVERYGLTPTCYSSWLDTRLRRDRSLTVDEAVPILERDLELAHRLGLRPDPAEARRRLPRPDPRSDLARDREARAADGGGVRRPHRAGDPRADAASLEDRRRLRRPGARDRDAALRPSDRHRDLPDRRANGWPQRLGLRVREPGARASRAGRPGDVEADGGRPGRPRRPDALRAPRAREVLGHGQTTSPTRTSRTTRWSRRSSTAATAARSPASTRGRATSTSHPPWSAGSRRCCAGWSRRTAGSREHVGSSQQEEPGDRRRQKVRRDRRRLGGRRQHRRQGADRARHGRAAARGGSRPDRGRLRPAAAEAAPSARHGPPPPREGRAGRPARPGPPLVLQRGVQPVPRQRPGEPVLDAARRAVSLDSQPHPRRPAERVRARAPADVGHRLQGREPRRVRRGLADLVRRPRAVVRPRRGVRRRLRQRGRRQPPAGRQVRRRRQALRRRAGVQGEGRGALARAQGDLLALRGAEPRPGPARDRGRPRDRTPDDTHRRDRQPDHGRRAHGARRRRHVRRPRRRSASTASSRTSFSSARRRSSRSA